MSQSSHNNHSNPPSLRQAVRAAWGRAWGGEVSDARNRPTRLLRTVNRSLGSNELRKVFRRVHRRLHPPLLFGLSFFVLLDIFFAIVLVILLPSSIRAVQRASVLGIGWAWWTAVPPILLVFMFTAIIWLKLTRITAKPTRIRDAWLAEGHCPACGYELATSEPTGLDMVICPECGAAWTIAREKSTP